MGQKTVQNRRININIFIIRHFKALRATLTFLTELESFEILNVYFSYFLLKKVLFIVFVGIELLFLTIIHDGIIPNSNETMSLQTFRIMNIIIFQLLYIYCFPFFYEIIEKIYRKHVSEI